ncbi:OmpA family protein [Gynurincola endophyticus]|jgi:outer membrane protein OmpA-like peptidoglycan-associated protein|uniref:OmpA family protein n=1 Tax=Gynurincola endophyticus TaxID=2479004 RepID=UPI000F8F6661|nr:OmpA family protein [Gynurincola endophyticus]
MISAKKTFIALAAAALILSSCESMNKTQKGAAIGTAGGAAIGAVIGKAAGNAGLGAVIGAAVGGGTGAVIGKKMDKQAAEIENKVPGAKVERVGEGIVVEFNSKILFGFDQSKLSADAKQNLDKLYTILTEYPDTDIEIQGHTDNTGTEAYNQTLSERRAGEVSTYLKSKGLASNRIKVVGHSFHVPIASNDTPEGRMENRRVNFIITANDKMVNDAKKEAGEN